MVEGSRRICANTVRIFFNADDFLTSQIDGYKIKKLLFRLWDLCLFYLHFVQFWLNRNYVQKGFNCFLVFFSAYQLTSESPFTCEVKFLE